MTPKPTVLLIEDESAIGSAMVKFLHVNDYIPTLCTNGAEALDAAEHFRPDVIITDIHLPDINGLVLSQKLRTKFGPDTPIIVLSGDTSTEVLKTLSHVGATYFFNKPVNLEMLKDRLDEYLNASPKSA